MFPVPAQRQQTETCLVLWPACYDCSSAPYPCLRQALTSASPAPAPLLNKAETISAPWEKPGLAPASYSSPLSPSSSPGQGRNLYSTKETLRSLRIVAPAPQTLSPPPDRAVTASTSQKKTCPMITLDPALPPKPLDIGRLHRDVPTASTQRHDFKTKKGMFSLIS